MTLLYTSPAYCFFTTGSFSHSKLWTATLAKHWSKFPCGATVESPIIYFLSKWLKMSFYYHQTEEKPVHIFEWFESEQHDVKKSLLLGPWTKLPHMSVQSWCPPRPTILHTWETTAGERDFKIEQVSELLFPFRHPSCLWTSFKRNARCFTLIMTEGLHGSKDDTYTPSETWPRKHDCYSKNCL